MFPDELQLDCAQIEKQLTEETPALPLDCSVIDRLGLYILSLAEAGFLVVQCQQEPQSDKSAQVTETA